MSVQSILKAKGSEVVTILSEAKAEAAAALMRAKQIGALVVMDAAGGMAGLLTLRHLAEGLAEHGASLPNKRVDALMRRDVVTVGRGDSTKHVMALMTLHRVTHIPVLDGARLAGIVSIGDLLKDRLGELELESKVLRDLRGASK